nr:MAG TPA: major capsid protein [Caudoviricetes sp.]
MKADFSGYATRANVLCSDGRTIAPNAFKHQDGATVPLVWEHGGRSLENILGRATLEHREDGMYATCIFNETATANTARELVKHGDLNSLSIYAKDLKQQGGTVMHGELVEVSLVLVGANPEARIDEVYLTHSDGLSEELEGEALIQFGSQLQHTDGEEESPAEEDGKTVADILDGMSEEEKNVVAWLVEQAAAGKLDDEEEKADEAPAEDAQHSAESADTIKHSDTKDSELTHNVFQGNAASNEIRHTMTGDQINGMIREAIDVGGKFSTTALKHAAQYGIEKIEYLFPEATAVSDTPDFIANRMEWVANVLGNVRRFPHGKVKSLHADITADEARAKGYTKGNKKVEEVFKLLKRETHPTWIYKKQKFDRQDVIDSTNLKVIDFVKQEMRVMLDKELARAILIGDGRQSSSTDKIDPEKLRPIWTDDELYAIHKTVEKTVEGVELVESVTRGMVEYRGKGMPTLFVSPQTMVDLQLVKDKNGAYMYPTDDILARRMRVSNIVEVPEFDGLKRTVGSAEVDLIGIAVNLGDYTLGNDSGGEISYFDFFDIDFNQMKYLYEIYMSGALTTPKAAVVFERKKA